MRAKHDGPCFRRAVAPRSSAVFGKARCTASMSACVVGAEPVRTDSTEERSVRARVSRSRTASASMVGTDVSQVTLNRPIASTYRRASNCGRRTMLAPAAKANLAVPSAFMWNSGAATSSWRRDRRQRPRGSGPHRPKLAVVGQRHALGPARRAGSVEHHRRLAGLRAHGLEGARIKEASEAVRGPMASKSTRGSPPVIGRGQSHRKMQVDLRVLEDECDRLARKLDVRRNRNETGAHDGKVSDQNLGPIEGKDGDRYRRARDRGRQALVRTHSPADQFAVR